MNESKFNVGTDSSAESRISLNNQKTSKNEKIVGFESTGNVVNDQKYDNEVWGETKLEWSRATHIGKCRICQKGNDRCPEVELNDDELCEKHAKKKKLIGGLLIALILAIILACILAFCGKWFDPNAANGPYSGKSEADIVRDLNAQVADGEMNVSIANTIRFPNGSQNDGIAHIENIAANHVDQKFLIYMADSEELLYESGAIAPNSHIDTIRLNRYLEPGRYKAIAIITGYETSNGDAIADFFNSLFNNHKKVGTLGAQINLVVE